MYFLKSNMSRHFCSTQGASQSTSDFRRTSFFVSCKAISAKRFPLFWCGDYAASMSSRCIFFARKLTFFSKFRRLNFAVFKQISHKSTMRQKYRVKWGKVSKTKHISDNWEMGWKGGFLFRSCSHLKWLSEKNDSQTSVLCFQRGCECEKKRN